MNWSDAYNELKMSALAGNAVLLESSSGIGKSAMPFKLYRELKAELAKIGKTVGISVTFAATQTPQTVAGLQFKGVREWNGQSYTISDPAMPVWFMSTEGKPASMYDLFITFIDEYGQGDPDTKRGWAEVLLNGGIPPWQLPNGSIRIAATNKGSRYGVTKDFDFCISRRTLIHIDGDVDQWLSNFADKPYEFQGKQWLVMPVTKAWAAAHPEILFEPEPKEQGPWCCPRSLTDCDRYLQVKQQHTKDNSIPTDPTTIESLAGRMGMPATQSFVGHLQYRLELPSYEDVVADPANCPIPTKADLLMLMTYELAGHTKAEHLAECITYISRMKAKDMAVTYVSSLLRRDYKGLINQPAMQGWINKNAPLVSIISSIGAQQP